MEAPERLYCMHRLSGDYSCSTTPFAGGDEYIRKDAFVEKVVNFLEILGYAYTITDNSTKSLYDNTQLIEDFKKYMEK